VIRGSLIALMGTIAKALRSLALSCLGRIRMDSPLLGRLAALFWHMLLCGFLPGFAGTFE